MANEHADNMTHISVMLCNQGQSEASDQCLAAAKEIERIATELAEAKGEIDRLNGDILVCPKCNKKCDVLFDNLDDDEIECGYCAGFTKSEGPSGQAVLLSMATELCDAKAEITRLDRFRQHIRKEKIIVECARLWGKRVDHKGDDANANAAAIRTIDKELADFDAAQHPVKS